MTKNILTESTKSKFKILENKPKNVLKRIQGVLSDFKSNRNGRIYPRELWENVLNSDYVKEMIESHGLVGELDHPEERLEISLQNVSHVINDMWIEGDQVLGTIDILPTPSGKIVSELLDYGTDIGISSRGAGSVGSNNVVDPDYQFVTFDFVARPSCEAARLNTILESVQPEIDTNSDDKVKSILEGYKTNLKEDTTMSEDELDDAILNNKSFDLDSFKKHKIGNSDSVKRALKNYYHKNALPAPGEVEIAGYDLSEVCDEVQKYHGLHNRREALDTIYEEDYTEADIRNIMEKAMKRDMKITESDFETYTDYSGERPVEKKRHTIDYCNMAALDMCLDALPDKLGSDWRKKSLSDIEDIVHETVFKYNEANVLPEYEEEDFYGDEANSREVYQYILDNEIPKENKTTETRPMNESAKSDQEVYRIVLNWYKQQIDSGKMTLNQCKQLLSDKAKVSLDRLINQQNNNQIRESLVNSTINKLIKESIDLNKTE